MQCLNHDMHEHFMKLDFRYLPSWNNCKNHAMMCTYNQHKCTIYRLVTLQSYLCYIITSPEYCLTLDSNIQTCLSPRWYTHQLRVVVWTALDELWCGRAWTLWENISDTFVQASPQTTLQKRRWFSRSRQVVRPIHPTWLCLPHSIPL